MSILPHNLQHYLSTHLTGAAGATSMLSGVADRLGADDLRAVVAELEEEQIALRGVMAEMDMSPSVVSRSVAVVGEVASRVGRTAQGAYDEDLRTLTELEAMVTGINGTKAMWRTLPDLVESHPPLAALDPQALLDQADRQEATVEGHRRAAARAALAG